ncbi:MAG: GGDEF domain-containing response regulator [Candidatus Saccharicenans sp.]
MEKGSTKISVRQKFPLLVAEDDPVTSRLLEKKLKEWGYSVYKAENGEKAWEILRKPGLRIALLDWMMPGIEGPQLCARLRQARKPRYTYLILLTAKDTSFDIIQGLEAGADDYMTKPVNFLELKARLQTAQRIIGLEDRWLQVQKKLTRLATTDPLTHAWNRRAIMRFILEEINRCQRDGRPFGLLMIDLDNFKQINDAYGHQGGDQVLRQVVRLFKNNLRTYDRIGRYGGDELIILLPSCNVYQTGTVASHLLELARKNNFNVRGRTTTPVTLSIGAVASDTLSQVNLDSLIMTADQALYLAKKLGRDRVIIFGDSVKPEIREKQNVRKNKFSSAD